MAYKFEAEEYSTILKEVLKECNVVLVRILFNFFCISMVFLMKIVLLTKVSWDGPGRKISLLPCEAWFSVLG